MSYRKVLKTLSSLSKRFLASRTQHHSPLSASTIMERDVLVTGYYGHGNLGDDILASYVLSQACKSVSTNRIIVDAPPRNYLEQWFPGICCTYLEHVLAVEPTITRRLICGGGGLFHQIGTNSSLDIWGLHSATIYKYYWSRFGGEQWQKLRKYAYCIGVGPLEGKGALWITRQLLNEFEFISVRDSASMNLLKGLDVKVLQSADAAFGLAQHLKTISEGKLSKSLGIVVRAWSYAPDLRPIYAELMSLATKLRRRGWNVEFISFEAGEFEEKSSGGSSSFEFAGEHIKEWNPNHQSIESFCRDLSRHSALITMRAHGVYLGGMLGVAVLPVEIEPKLRITAEICGCQDYIVSVHDTADEMIELLLFALDKFREREQWHEEQDLVERASKHLIDWLREDSLDGIAHNPS